MEILQPLVQVLSHVPAMEHIEPLESVTIHADVNQDLYLGKSMVRSLRITMGIMIVFLLSLQYVHSHLKSFLLMEQAVLIKATVNVQMGQQAIGLNQQVFAPAQPQM